MTWGRLDDKAHGNAKLRAAKLDGAGLHFLAMSWCADYETDGRISFDTVRMLASELTPAALKSLLGRLTAIAPGQENPLWHDMGDGTYLIHDYLEYNPSHADLEKKRTTERARIAANRKAST